MSQHQSKKSQAYIYHYAIYYHSFIIKALVYQTLYKFVFKLPDVDFAVNKMLHESSGVGDMKSEILQQVNEDNQTRCTAINNEMLVYIVYYF